jgi:hypothetical protein
VHDDVLVLEDLEAALDPGAYSWREARRMTPRSLMPGRMMRTSTPRLAAARSSFIIGGGGRK